MGTDNERFADLVGYEIQSLLEAQKKGDTWAQEYHATRLGAMSEVADRLYLEPDMLVKEIHIYFTDEELDPMEDVTLLKGTPHFRVLRETDTSFLTPKWRKD